MSCDFAEKVSMLVDGELPPEESDRVRDHIKSCHICLRAEEDFLRLREQMRSYRFEADPAARQRALGKITRSRSRVGWRSRVPVPAPLLALLLVAVAALGVWSLFMRSTLRAYRESVAQSPRTTVRPAEDTAIAAAPAIFGYDRGGRAAIYKISLKEQRDPKQ